MENALIYAALGLAALTSIIALVLFISRVKLQESIRSLQDKLTLEQARRAEFAVANAQVKKKSESAKVPSEKNKHEAEVIELRKTSAHLRDEVKHLKQELRQSESQNKDLMGRVENETFKLKAENQALIERLRESETNSPDKKRASALEQELVSLKEAFKSLQNDHSASTAKLKSERVAANRLKQSAESLERQVRDLKSRLPEDNAPESPRIDPKMLERWKDRALTARHMYQMMRQMRELSDLKLSTYQEAIVDVSKTLLEMKGANSPTIGPSENKADRYLAEAWSLVQTQSDTSPNV